MPVQSYLSGGREAALAEQEAAAAEPGNNQALEQVRLASMAYALGDTDLAERALRGAVSRMSTFQADGEFRAAVGAESSKEWKGEPYERMAAFLMLGLLLHAEGDRGNALAMYKSAILADTGTAVERYRSDFVPAWVLQAFAYQAEGEQDSAEQAMRRGVDARWSRRTLDLISDALLHVRAADLTEQQHVLAKAALTAGLSAGVTAAPRDPGEAARASQSMASDLLLSQQKLPARERIAALQGFSKNDFEEAAAAMSSIVGPWRAVCEAIPSDRWEDERRFALRMEALLTEQPNTILLVERGAAPRKIRTGQHGQLLQIEPDPRSPSPPVVRIDGERAESLWLDSASYQATTRGGRQVDAFLQGKAIFKDVGLISGRVLLEVADALAWQEFLDRDGDSHSEAAAALYIIGGALFVAGALTNPSADIRSWELMPEAWYLVAAKLPAGTHSLELEGRSHTLSVPGRGQTVALLPSLEPGGPRQIGIE